MNRFHEKLYHFILEHQPEVVVETGFASGLSAMHILAAMDLNTKGRLWSVECFVNQPIFHPRLGFKRGMSAEQLPDIFAESGPWNMFLHDSDHEAGCQTFEYELAWSFLKPGGVLMTDDYEWGTHRSWKKFKERHGVEDAGIIGSAAYCFKPIDGDKPVETPSWTREQVRLAGEMANRVCRELGVEEYVK